MNLRTITITLMSVGSLSIVNAQQLNGLYFKDFTEGKVILKNLQFAKGQFNYDCINQEMLFLNGNSKMIVGNLEDIDTISINSYRFIPYKGHFMEVKKGKKVVLYIDWKMSVNNVGKKGAMGITTQGTVQAIDVNTRFQRVNGEQNLDLSVYKMETKNDYFTYINGDLKSFRNAKTLINLFPKDKKQSVKDFLDKEKVDFDNPNDLLKTLDKFL